MKGILKIAFFFFMMLMLIKFSAWAFKKVFFLSLVVAAAYLVIRWLSNRR